MSSRTHNPNTLSPVRRLSIDQAARIALHSQGFGRPRPTGKIDVRHFRRVLDLNSVVQLDSVNVAARAHYMPFFSRLGAYDRDKLDYWLWLSRENFEYWGHVASVMPMRVHRLMRHRMDGEHPWRYIRELAKDHPGFVESVLDAVRDAGPMSVSDLEHAGESAGSWWGWKPGRIVLEWLYMKGDLAIHRRDPQFKIFYDVAERVIPASVLAEAPASASDAARELVLLGARAQGVASIADLADQFRLKKGEARPAAVSLVSEGLLEEVEVDGWKDPAYLWPDATMPRRVHATALLSPFDPVVWNRDRLQRLFGFDYRIEIYVPKPKRRFGYYVLPFMLDGRFVARVDVKADRERRRLLVQSAHGETGVEGARVAQHLMAELELMAGWLGLDDVEVNRKGDLAEPLART